MSAEADDVVLVGAVRRPHGIRGEVLVEVLTDNAERFQAGSSLLVIGPEGISEMLSVETARPHRGAVRVRFEGFQDRDQADELRGCRLAVPAAEVAPAPGGAYYQFELLGCVCTDARLGRLGVVSAVREDGGGWILEIDGDGERLLVPFVRAFLVEIDTTEKRIALELPEGLVETCSSRS